MVLRFRSFWVLLFLQVGLFPLLAGAQAYTSIVVFGDSLSDTGNVAHLTSAKYTAALQVPGPVADYTNGRFTDGSDTVPAAHNYFGVWIEQLAAMIPAKPALMNSLDGGTNYAFGFATTGSGTSPFAFGPGNIYSVSVENMGQQLADYLATNPAITNKTLFVVWGGANDLLNATSSAAVTTAATQELAIIQRLILAGATDFIVPNLPPLGLIPRLNGSVTASASATQAAAAFNQALAAGLASLPAANPGKTLRVYPLDVYTLFNSVVGPPTAAGFSNVTSSSQINPLANPDTYLFWDDLHPTTFGHHAISLTGAGLIAPAVATTTVVTSSVLNANLASPVTFTATVSSAIGAPTGTVTFFDGTASLGMGTLASAGATSATATLMTSSLSSGTHTIMATYAGTTATAGAGAYAASASATIPEVVTAPAVGSALAPASITVARGSSGTAMVTVTPVGGFSGTVSLGCGTLAADLVCSFSSGSLTFSGNNVAQTSTVTVGTAGNFASLRVPEPGRATGLQIFSAVLLLPCFGLGGVVLLRRRGVGLGRVVLLVVMSAGAAFGVSGCTSPDNRAPSGTYTVPVNVTATGSTTTLNLTVAVQ